MEKSKLEEDLQNIVINLINEEDYESAIAVLKALNLVYINNTNEKDNKNVA